MAELLAWFDRWGGAASIAGLVVSLIGFGITIYAVLKSKSASQRAAEAVDRVRALLTFSAAVADVSAAVTSMQEIKRLHRVRAWAILPDRYASLRERLIAIRAANTSIDDAGLIAIRGAEERLADLERRVDKALAEGREPARVTKFNEIVAADLDRLHEVLTSLKLTVRD